jgi:hypothetical protein
MENESGPGMRNPWKLGFRGGAAYRNRTDDLRITRVFPCLARRLKARFSLLLAGCC